MRTFFRIDAMQHAPSHQPGTLFRVATVATKQIKSNFLHFDILKTIQKQWNSTIENIFLVFPFDY